TRATSNQTLDVVSEMLEGVGSAVSPRLIYSGAVNPDKPRTVPTAVAQDSDEPSDVEAQDWFVSKRSLLTSVGVGTVDQLLKGALRSGHVFVRLAALSNKVVIVDEVHGYDVAMSRLLDRVLLWLGRLGVSVVLLSATLPTLRRRELVTAWQAGAM